MSERQRANDQHGTGIRWAYALNQWKPQFDDFVRREEHERACKTVAIAGFAGVELTAGTGRWEPFGNPEQVDANFGSPAGLREFLGTCGLEGVSSWFYDPEQRYHETLTGPLSPLVEADAPAIAEKAEWFARSLAQAGGSVLVVRAAPSAGDVDPLDGGAVARLAACWEAVGRATRRHGVRTALHVDFLSALRRGATLDDWALGDLLDRTDPDLVGLALDTGELTVAGVDPVAVIDRYPGRIRHVQYQDALAVDDAGEYRQPHAHYTVRVRGGAREVPRWFAEPGADDGLVDFPAVTRALTAAGYAGWIVFESLQSPHPAQSALVGGYLLQRELRPLTTV